MTGVTNTELAVAIQQVITRVDAREGELKGWQAGTFDGGPFGDGRYGITNLLGEVGFFKAPARLEYEVDLLTTAGTGAVAAAQAAQSASEAALASALAQATGASQSASAASTSASQAQTFRNEAANSEANALVHRNAASAAADATSTDVIAADWARISAELARDATLLARDETLVARGDALVARDEAQGFAASIDPSLLATKAELQTSLNALVDAAPGTLDTLNEIAAALGDDPNFATTVTTSLAGKAPLVHGHVISDVTGLQTALDGKQPIGSYAASAHNHVISNVTGLQTALDARVLTSNFTWTNLSGKPSTFAPSAHNHIISDVTGLQTALDGKQPLGSYAASAHAHVISDVTGLQTALDGKQAAGSYAASAHNHVISNVTGLQSALDGKLASASFTWTNLSGKPSTFAPSAHNHIIADVTGLQTALDGKLSLTGGTLTGALQANVGGGVASSTFAARFLNGSAFTGFLSRATAGAYNSLVQANDAALIFSTGTTETGALTIAPWSASTAGFRMTAAGAVSITGSLSVNGRNVLSDIDSKAAGFHTHAIADVTGLQAALADRALRTGGTFTGGIEVAQSGNVASLTGDGSIELMRAAANGGGPYIDFKDSTAEDFDVRVQANGTELSIAATALLVGGTQVSLSGHTHSIAQVSGLQGALDGKASLSGANFTGNVGIGTSSPAQKLHVSGAALTVPAAGWSSGQVAYNYLGDTNNGISSENGGYTDVFGFSGISFSSTGFGGEKMRITPSGNVGIGTSSPSNSLTVQNNTAPTFFDTTLDNTAMLSCVRGAGANNFGASLGFSRLDSPGRVNAAIAIKQTSADSDQCGLSFFTHASASTGATLQESMVINHAGNVGIGTAAPQRMLHLATAEPTVVLQSTSAAADKNRWRTRVSTGGDFSIGAINDAFNAGQDAYQIIRGSGIAVDSHRFITANAERLRIDSSGNVGIGLTNPSERLHVSGNARVTGSLVVGSANVGTTLTNYEDRITLLEAQVAALQAGF